MAAPPYHHSTFRILVAEDNAINRRFISVILREADFEVDVVSDGIEAVAAYRSTPFGLILMDLQMPRMDGWEAAAAIRRLQQPQPMIVAVTANVVAGVRERCLGTGMDDYLSKPFTRNQLLEVVRRVYGRLTPADKVRRAS